MESAESSWNYIKSEISEMNDNSRCNKALEDFKNKVANATDSNDSI